MHGHEMEVSWVEMAACIQKKKPDDELIKGQTDLELRKPHWGYVHLRVLTEFTPCT